MLAVCDATSKGTVGAVRELLVVRHLLVLDVLRLGRHHLFAALLVLGFVDALPLLAAEALVSPHQTPRRDYGLWDPHVSCLVESRARGQGSTRQSSSTAALQFLGRRCRGWAGRLATNP